LLFGYKGGIISITTQHKRPGGMPMNIGEQIKYMRKKRKITQNQLAEMTGIHPVTIRKYETDRLQPKKEQVDKIADALSVSPLAFGEFNNNVIRLETEGDLMGLLIMLYKSKVVHIHTPEADEQDAAFVEFSPLLSYYFSLTENKKSIPMKDGSLRFENSDMQKDFVTWARLYDKHMVMTASYADKATAVEKDYLAGNEDQLAMIEMELQTSSVRLEHSDDLEVKSNDTKN